MLKLIVASIARTIQKVREKPRAVVVPIVGLATLMAVAISSIGLRKENIEKERGFAFSAIEETLKLSKAIGEFYDSDNKQGNLIRSKNNFLEITSQLKNLSDAKAGSQFISTARKTSEFFNSYCDHQIDVINKTEAMKLDMSVNNHVDTTKVENILNDKAKYGSQANQLQNEVLRAIPKAFVEWEKVLSPEDCHEIFGYIDEHFADEKKKSSDQKEKKSGSELYLHECISMQINEEVFNRWMTKELGDLISKFDAQNKGDAE